MPNISIIIPVHNVAQYIEETINSILQQTYKDWEAIVVNDGSSDSTADIVRRLAVLDSRIQLVDQRQSGVSVARNMGISLAKGQVLTFLDGDDLWKPSFLSEMLAVYNQGYDLVLCDFQRLYPNNVIKDNPPNQAFENMLVAALNENLNFNMGTLLIKKKILNEYNILFTSEYKICEDVEFILKLLTVCESCYLPQKLMLYRKLRPHSATATRWDYSIRIASVSAMETIFAFIKQNYTGTDKEHILQICKDKIRRSMFRYLWKLIRHGYQDQTFELLKNKDWYSEITLINKDKLSTAERLRYAIIINKNRLLWKGISCLKRR